jgi:hypothetical protein
MELDVWTSSTVHSARPNDGGTWDVAITTGTDCEGSSISDCRFKVKHVVFGTGLGAGEGKLPTYPGMVRLTIFRCCFQA